MHRNFTIVSRRVTWFSPKCPEIIRQYKKGQSLNSAIKRSLFSTWKMNSELLKNINIDNIFNAIHDRSTLQQAQIAKLMETMFSVSICERTSHSSRLDHWPNSNFD